MHTTVFLFQDLMFMIWVDDQLKYVYDAHFICVDDIHKTKQEYHKQCKTHFLATYPDETSTWESEWFDNRCGSMWLKQAPSRYPALLSTTLREATVPVAEWLCDRDITDLSDLKDEKNGINHELMQKMIEQVKIYVPGGTYRSLNYIEIGKIKEALEGL